MEVALLPSLLAQKRESAVDAIADLVGHNSQVLRRAPPNLLLVVLEPLLYVCEVGVKGTLIPWMNHPHDEEKLQKAVDVASIKRE